MNYNFHCKIQKIKINNRFKQLYIIKPSQLINKSNDKLN